jgi:hypothetical protein
MRFCHCLNFIIVSQFQFKSIGKAELDTNIIRSSSSFCLGCLILCILSRSRFNGKGYGAYKKSVDFVPQCKSFG